MPPSDLRTSIHAQIDSMDETRLALVERVPLALEAEELTAGINAGFDADHRLGLLTPERVQAVVTGVRTRRSYR